MRITPLAFLALPLGSHAFVPLQSADFSRASTTTSLHERKGADTWFGPAAAAVAGWTLAAQLAFANPLPVPQQLDAPSPSLNIPTVLLSAKVEIVDFSMPSYDDATKGDTTGVKETPNIPSFNPFGSLGETKEVEEPSAVVDEKASAAAKKAEEKAAAEAKKAEEQAAAEAKKAEKEARRKAELEKQKEAVARAMQKKTEESGAPSVAEEAAVSEISIPSFSAPDLPDIKMPEMKVPDIPKFSMPKFDVPKIDLPDKQDMPKLDAIKVPEFSAPTFTAPKMPEFTAPTMPEFTAPKIPEFTAPKMPEFTAPKIPEFTAPKLPESGTPKLPSFSVPSFEAPKPVSGYDFDSPISSSSETNVEPQEIRDARAREGRSVYVAADNEAKELERQARELRNIANEKKKIAKELKDAACETRFGGKFICLRPLNSGY